ncbi:Phostensin Protein phosphatase 1 F-actin cytoskeleton targeting subunit [Triplophysa tibetana]|uniref:Phostensin Protein phosphatase 1 F-actin cytoskeleton targeting subunit n=1 Tax=Triplophysa tibetana TaxID=1572043 RepID=A0A5A9NKU6_9TELE|nr:Phostensin Protein phosphatase 1 F-actin cytoskeleton targeting subunit [Triplophysa tibetana]
MSLSGLPEWKQLLLERKRRDEEERERREREEEERLASMPAWKREIIQRRKAKQDEEREREKEKDGGQHTADVSAIIEEVVVTEQNDNKPNLATPNQLSIRQNPFICSEQMNSWRRDSRQQANNYTVRGRNGETEKEESRGKEREFRKDRDIRIERTESQSEDRSTGREQVQKCRTSLFYPITGLRTIKANNIIIIEKEKNHKERPERRDSGREEVHREEKRMRMDLREFLAGGGSVTEIRASEVLIIKPPATDEKAEAEIPEVQERVSSRERLERERVWRKEREIEEDQRTNRKNEVECGGRVSQLLSKFGELPKPPVRSKSTDCFDQLGKNRARYSTGDLHVQEDEHTQPTFRGVPKRSFSFSDRAVCHRENRACEEELEFRVVERTYSDRRVKPSAMVTGTDQTESEARVTRRWGRQRRDDEGVMLNKRQKERNQTVCRETDGEQGFTVASVKNPEGVAFAQRVQIKQERRENSSERENRREREEKMDEEKQADKGRDTMEEQNQISSTRTWNQDGMNVVTALKQSVKPSNECTDYNTALDAQRQVTTTSEVDSLQSSAFTVQPGSRSQQTEDLHCRTEIVRELNKPFSCGDPDMTSGEMNQHTAHTTSYLKDQNLKQATDNSDSTSNISQQPGTLSQNKPCTQEEITIPTTVFYGVEVSAVRKTSVDKTGDGQGGAGVERRGSWKAGRPLTRVESLRERLRQQEEMQRVRKTEAMDSTEAEGTVREVTAIQQEATTLQSLRVFDVTQEVAMPKASPQLPVPVSLSHLPSASTEREVGEITRDECESDLYRRETETAHHVEECGSRSIWRRQNLDVDVDDIERELSEEEYLPPSLSPSPPLSDLLDEMSRIYNLKAVGSRTAVCISERKGDISTLNRGTHGQYKPIRTAQSPDILPETAKLWNCGTARDVDKTETVEATDAQTVQRQVERLQLKEQEGACQSQSDREQEAQTVEGQKRPDILKETPKSQVQQKSQRSHPKLQQLKSFTVNARNAQATENPSRSPEQGNCPSPSSPSTTPTHPLFSIRSASGGAGKRGTTITITPRRSGAVSPSAGTTGPSGTPPRAAPQGQTSTTSTGGNREANKKRYPTAEEIEVIGGYQSLERSCLVKSRGAPKAVKVYFDDIQLERVCEYPSEDCTLESLPCTPQRSEDRRDQEEDEDEENTSRSDMSVNAGRVRFLRVGQCFFNHITTNKQPA